MATRQQKVAILLSARYNPLKALGSDLIAWWDADSRYWGGLGGMTDDGAGVISSWRDIVAGYDATAATTARPTFSATSFNGAPGVTFDGTANAMTCTTAALLSALPAGGNASELWGLGQQDALVADTTSRAISSYGADGGGNGGRQLRRVVAGGVNRGAQLTGSGASSSTVNDTAVNLSSRHVLRGIVGASETSIVVDGNAAVSVSITPNTTNNRVRLGAANATAAAAFWHGQIACVLFMRQLSAGKAAPLQNWLMSRRRL